MRCLSLTACAAVALLLFVAADTPKPLTVELSSFTLKGITDNADLTGYNAGESKLFFYTNGTATAKVKVPADGTYELVVKASGDKAQDVGAKFKVAADGKAVGKETEAAGDPTDYKFTAEMKAGEIKLTIEFTNDVHKDGEYDRNLYLHGVELKKVK